MGMVTAARVAPAVVGVEQPRPAAPQVSRRRRKSRRVVFARTLFSILAVLFLFGYIGLYAQVTIYGYHGADLARQIRQIETENQALRVEIQTLSNPDRLGAVAVGAGMQPRAEVVYIPVPRPVEVAKAE